MVTPSPTRYQAAERGWTLKATYVEIYNEQLRDLLLPESMAPSERSAVIIREDVRGRILLTGLHQVAINSIDDLLNALNFGSSIRQTDATAINAQSSRSHAIFSLNLVQRKDRSATATTTTTTIAPRDKRRSMPLEAMSGSDGWITIDSKLHFVDLAGSERLKVSLANVYPGGGGGGEWGVEEHERELGGGGGGGGGGALTTTG